MQNLRTGLIHGGLFLLTVFTTILAGAEWVSGGSWLENLTWSDFGKGIPYSIAFLSFLSFHEFGHYFTARFHQVRTTLPYYIPFFIPGILNIGSFGAVIALRERPSSTRKYFDIGIAGPLAGFVVSLFLLIYGLTHLPDYQTYVLDIHPEYQEIFGGVPTETQMEAHLEENGLMTYAVGSSLLMEILIRALPVDPSQVPAPFELMHYPFLFVGYITLFFTALNLLPIGQLDGGHIIYGMFGRKTGGHISRIALLGLLFMGGTGLWEIPEEIWGLSLLAVYIAFLLYIISKALPGLTLWQHALIWLAIMGTQILIKQIWPEIMPNLIWLIYSILVVRFIKLDHPPAYFEHRVNLPRKLLGWLAILIFILCFSPTPLEVRGELEGDAQQELVEKPANTSTQADSLPVE